MSESNPGSRLEAFCDGVFAIALTLLIIDIKIPSTEEITTTADFAILAIWFPLAIAICTVVTWIFWLIWGVRLKHE